MNDINFGTVVAIAGLISTVMSIFSFWLGQKKAASQEGKSSGILETNMNNLENSIEGIKKSVEALSNKIDLRDQRWEQDYRNLLVKQIEVETQYRSLHKRVDELNTRINALEGIK